MAKKTASTGIKKLQEETKTVKKTTVTGLNKLQEDKYKKDLDNIDKLLKGTKITSEPLSRTYTGTGVQGVEKVYNKLTTGNRGSENASLVSGNNAPKQITEEGRKARRDSIQVSTTVATEKPKTTSLEINPQTAQKLDLLLTGNRKEDNYSTVNRTETGTKEITENDKKKQETMRSIEAQNGITDSNLLKSGQRSNLLELISPKGSAKKTGEDTSVMASQGAGRKQEAPLGNNMHSLAETVRMNAAKNSGKQEEEKPAEESIQTLPGNDIISRLIGGGTLEKTNQTAGNINAADQEQKDDRLSRENPREHAEGQALSIYLRRDADQLKKTAEEYDAQAAGNGPGFKKQALTSAMGQDLASAIRQDPYAKMDMKSLKDRNLNTDYYRGKMPSKLSADKATEYWAKKTELIESGEFDPAEGDYSGLLFGDYSEFSPNGRGRARTELQGYIKNAQGIVDIMNAPANYTYATKLSENGNEVTEDMLAGWKSDTWNRIVAERYPGKTSFNTSPGLLWFMKKTGDDLTVHFEDAQQEWVLRSFYDTINGEGAYRRATSLMDSSEKTAFDGEILRAVAASGLIDSDDKTNGLQGSIDWANGRLGELDYWDKSDAEYDRIQPGATVDGYDQLHAERKMLLDERNSLNPSDPRREELDQRLAVVNKNINDIAEYNAESRSIMERDDISGTLNPDLDVENANIYNLMWFDNANSNTGTPQEIYSFVGGGKVRQAYDEIWQSFDGEVSPIMHYAMMMLPEEKEKFMRLYESETDPNKPKAMAYLNGLQPFLTRRYSDWKGAANREFAEKNPVVAIGVSSLINFFAPVTEAARRIAGDFGDPTVNDPNGQWFEGQRLIRDTDETIIKNLGEKYGDLAVFGYQTGKSMLDDSLRQVATLGLASLGIINPSAMEMTSIVWAGAQAYPGAFVEAMEKTNGDVEKSRLAAYLDAAVEMGTEIYSAGVIFGEGNSVPTKMVISGLSEALEEVAGGIAKPLGERFLFGKSEYDRQADEIWTISQMNGGVYYDENGKPVKIENHNAAYNYMVDNIWIPDILNSAASALFSGGAEAVAVEGFNSIHQARTGQSILRGRDFNGEKIRNGSGKTSIALETVLTVGENMGEDTESKQRADNLRTRIRDGEKLRARDVGKLVESIYVEGSAETAKESERIYADVIASELKEKGVAEDRAKAASELIAKARVEGTEALTKAEKQQLMQDETAYQTYLALLKNGNASAEGNAIAAKAEKSASEAPTIAEKIEGTQMSIGMQRKLKYLNEQARADSIAKTAQMASKQQLKTAIGNRTGTAADVVVGNRIGQVTGFKEDTKTGEILATVQFDDGTEDVGLSEVYGTDSNVAGLVKYAQVFKGSMTPEYLTAAVRTAQELGENINDKYLAEAERISLAAWFGESMPTVSMDKTAAENLYKIAQAEQQAAEDRRTQNPAQALNPGKGRSVFNGVEYGSKGWKAALNKLPENIRKNDINVLAELNRRLGFDLVFIHNPNDTDMFGYENGNTGRITVNLAAMNANEKGRSYLTIAGHEFTHWLQYNSKAGYAALRNFIIKSYRQEGKSVENMVLDKLASYQSGMQARADEETKALREKDQNAEAVRPQRFVLEDAIYEVIAEASDQVLASDEMAKRLQAEDPNLYGKFKQFIKNFFSNLKQAIGYMRDSGSISRESAALMRAEIREGIAKHWLAAYDEAMGVERPTEFAAGEDGKINYSQAENSEQNIWHSFRQATNVFTETEQERRNRIIEANNNVRKKISKWRTDKALTAKEVEELIGKDNIPPALSQWLHNAFEKTGRKVLKKNVEKFIGADNDLINKETKALKEKWEEMSNNGERIYKKEITVNQKNDTIRFMTDKEIGNELFGTNNNYAIYKNHDTGADIRLNRDAIKETSTSNKGFTPRSVVVHTLLNAKELIENAKYIGSHENYANPKGDVHYFVSNIKIGENRNTVLFAVHDAIHPLQNFDENAYIAEIYFLNKNEETPSPLDSPNLQTKKEGGGSQALRQAVSSPNSIEEVLNIVNADRFRFYDKNEIRNKSLSFSFRQSDAAYMKAVKNGDTDAAQYYVNKAAEQAGYTDTAYHGTEMFGFTNFDLKAGQDTIFVAYNKKLASSYTKVNEVRNISDRKGVPINPYAMSIEDLTKYAKKYIKTVMSDDVLDIWYDKDSDKFTLKVKDYWKGEERETHMHKFEVQAAIDNGQNPAGEYDGIYELYTRPGKQLVVDAEGNDWNDIYFDLYKWENRSSSLDEEDWVPTDWEWDDEFDWSDYEDGTMDMTANTRQIAKWAKAHGYDSVRINNVHDNGGRNRNVSYEEGLGDIGIFFNANDVKSADAIVYDDQGDVIPPSERFNPEKTDIRYSFRESEKIYKSLNISPEVYFTGTMEQIDAAEKAENERAEEFKQLIQKNGLMAMEFIKKDGRREILSHSLRKGIEWQLSYFGNDGLATMHENYGRTGEKLQEEAAVHSMDELYRHFVNLNLRGDITFHILEDDNVVSEASIQKAIENPKKSFSMKTPVEATEGGRLLAVHNLEAENLMKSIQLGGFPMPSIAIIKDDYAHNRYGDTSVIFYPSAIDPKASKNNKVYSGDAWTPTYPYVEYKLSENVLKKVNKKISSLIPENILKGLSFSSLDETNLSKSVNSARGDIVKAVKDNKKLKLAYMLDSGEKIDFPMREKRLSNRFDNKQIVDIVNELGKETVTEAYMSGSSWFDEHPDVVEKIRKIAADAWMDDVNKKLGPDDQRKLKVSKMNPYSKENWGFSHNYSAIEGAWKYLNRGIEQELDESALDNVLKQEINEKEYEKWIEEQFSGIIEKSGIRNNKPYYTNSGNPRSWEALHDEETLDNIVKVMRGDTDKGSNAFFSQSEMLAVGTRDFKSLDEIRKHKDQLKHISEEEMSAAKSNIVNEFGKLMDEMADKSERNIFIARDRALQAMVEAARKSRTPAGIMNELKQWHGLNLPADAGERIANLLEEIANLPTEYFEGKPRRAVGLNEIAKVVIPETASEELKNQLDIHGIAYETYDGTDEDRLEKLNNGDNYHFSIKNPGDLDVNQWMKTVTPGMLRTPAERKLVADYRGLRTKIELEVKKQSDYKNKLAVLEAKEDPTQSEKRQAEGLRMRIKNSQAIQQDYEDKLYEITGSEGYATMMYNQSKIMESFLNGKTEAQVRDSVEAMQRQNTEAQKKIDKLSAELKELAGSKEVRRVRALMNQDKLNELAKKLRTDYNSTMDRQELTDELAMIRLKMQRGQDASSDVENLAGRIVNDMQPDADPTLTQMRGMTIQVTPEQLKELKGRGESMKTIRSKLAGTGIKVEQGSVNTLVDNLSELQERFGADLDFGGEKDALSKFADWVENLKQGSTETREQYRQNMAEVMSDVYGAIAQVELNLPKDKATRDQFEQLFRYVEEVAKQAEKGAEIMDGMKTAMREAIESGKSAAAWTESLRNDVDATIDYFNKTAQLAEETAQSRHVQQVIEQLKSKHVEEMIKRNEQWRNMIERDRNARIQNEANNAKRRIITTDATRLMKLLVSPKGEKVVPEHMNGMARKIIELLVDNDLLGGRKITDIEKRNLFEYKRILNGWNQRDGRFNIDDLQLGDDNLTELVKEDLAYIEDKLKEWNDRYYGKNKLDTLEKRGSTLEQLQEAISEIYSIIKQEQSIEIGDRRVLVADQAYKVQQAIAGRKFREWNGKAGKVIAALHKGIVSGNMTPEYFFRTLRNEGMWDLWEEYHKAENRNGLELARSKDRLAEIAKKHGYSSWDMGERKTLEMANGDKVSMTIGQLMSLYATWNREQQLGPEMSNHLKKGGFFVDESDPNRGIISRVLNEKRAHRVTEADMDKVNNLLTEEQKQFVYDVVQYMSNEMSELGNEASMKAYGIKMYKEKYYFPFKIWDGVKSRKSNDAGNGANIDRAFHPSFSKARTHNAGNALILGDFMQTAADHIAGMINYATMGLANETMQKVLNFREQQDGSEETEQTARNIRAMLEEAYGRTAMNYLEDLKTQLNGGAVRIDRTFYDKLISLFRKNAVAGSLSVAAQQPLSYIRAAMLIDPKYLARALAPDMWRGSYKEMMEHSGVAVIKEMGRFDMNAGQSAREYLMPDGYKGKGKAAYDKAVELATMLPERMDRMTWTRMWSAVKAEQMALNPKMDPKSEAFLDKVATRFNEVMRRTQVYDSVLVRSKNMRSQSKFFKGITSFMAEPTLTLNVLADSARMAIQGEKGGIKTAAKAGATFMLSGILQSVIKALFSAGRTPDEKKTFLENFLYRLESNLVSELNPLSMIPGYSDLVNILEKGKIEDDALGVIGKIISAGETAIDLMLGKSDKSAHRAIEDSAGQLVQIFTGVPLKNIMRDGRAIYNWISGAPYADRPTNPNVLKYQGEAAFWDADSIISAINSKLGDAGFETKNSAYYERIYEAKKAGDEETAAGLTDYLMTGKGLEAKTITSGVKSAAKADKDATVSEKAEIISSAGGDPNDYVMDQVKAGELDEKEALKILKEQNPDKDENDLWWKVDRAAYTRDTGISLSGTPYYYRMYDAIDANDSTAIKTAVRDMTAHGRTNKQVQDQIRDKYKKQYLELPNGREKVALKNALIMAYKATGMTEAEAEATINGWKAK